MILWWLCKNSILMWKLFNSTTEGDRTQLCCWEYKCQELKEKYTEELSSRRGVCLCVPLGALPQTQWYPSVSSSNHDKRWQWLGARALTRLSHMIMKHCCLLISRNIKYPLKEKLVTELENHLTLELRDLSKPDVLQTGITAGLERCDAWSWSVQDD